MPDFGDVVVERRTPQRGALTTFGQQDSLSTAVCIVTGSHLCHNPRVIKEAGALARAGFDVEVLGAWTDDVLKKRDLSFWPRIPFRFTPVIDLTERNFTAKLRKLVCRLRNKTGQLAFRICGLQNRWQLGYSVVALTRAARKRTADLFIAHSEAALIVARDLLDAGHRVAVDMEDWFSEDLLPSARTNRPTSLLGDLERELLQTSTYATCPSRVMSEALARSYRCSPPMVLYNAFPWSDRTALDRVLKERRDRRIPSIHWSSQTIGEGRGLEDLLAALPEVTHAVEIHLRGNPVAGFDRWLSARIPRGWKERVFVHDLVANEELLSRIAEHDIGFAGEMKYCRSRDLTVTNKILHYLLGGLAVVASDTEGQQEVATQAPGAVLLYPSGDAAALAAQLNALLDCPERLAGAKAAALRAARETFCWERQEAALLGRVTRALDGASRTPRTHE